MLPDIPEVVPVIPAAPAVLFGGCEVSFYTISGIGLVERLRAEPDAMP